VLGIESSCDETAAAVLSDGTQILSNIVSSQVEIHRPYGGVVPELASRHHIRNIVPVVKQALFEASVTLKDIDGVAVTRGPGLVGALLVGIQVAKSLAYATGIPFIGINHLEGHLCASLLEDPDKLPPKRHVALLVSGGHTALVLVEGFGQYTVLGRSRDDAAGEAFDKVAKLLELGYPGGPLVERFAADGDDSAVSLPRALPGKDNLDFSFSGLKTAVAHHIDQISSTRDSSFPLVPLVPLGTEALSTDALSTDEALLGTEAPSTEALSTEAPTEALSTEASTEIPKTCISQTELVDLCASFQRAVADVLVRKACRAVQLHRATALVAAGGVLANHMIRRALTDAANTEGFSLFIPPVGLCTDNAAMIAAAGTIHLRSGTRSSMELNASPRLALA
jgi:N6-L-threonylcarbamoyladenine synthase